MGTGDKFKSFGKENKHLKEERGKQTKFQLNWRRTSIKTDAIVFWFILMVFLQVICYNDQQFQEKNRVKDCQSVRQSVLAETNLPFVELGSLCLVLDQSSNGQMGN